MPLHNIRAFYQFLEQMLKPLGDPAYQQRIWVENEGPEVDDYDEAVMYFLEGCKEIFNDSNCYEGVDDMIQETLKKIYDRIRQFNSQVACEIEYGRDDEIIAHPEWIEIQKMAAQSYQIIINRLKEKNYESFRPI